jgi:hypothetical protein
MTPHDKAYFLINKISLHAPQLTYYKWRDIAVIFVLEIMNEN